MRASSATSTSSSSSSSSRHHGRNRLVRLDLHRNGIVQMPRLLERATRLECLHVSENPITSLEHTDLFAKLSNLRQLELHQLLLDQSLLAPQSIELPSGLSKLSLVGFAFSHMPFRLSGGVADSLHTLELTGWRWLRVRGPRTAVFFQAVYDEFHLLFAAGSDHLETLFNHFDVGRKGYLNERETIALNAAMFARTPRLGSATATATELATNPSAIPAEIFTLVNLTRLDLSFQAIRHIPDDIGALVHLEVLVCDSCILLETLSPKLAALAKLNAIDVAGCLSLKTPPPEICNRGFDSVIGYLRRLASGFVFGSLFGCF